MQRTKIDGTEYIADGHQFTGFADGIAIVKPELKLAPGFIAGIKILITIAVQAGESSTSRGERALTSFRLEELREQFGDRADLHITAGGVVAFVVEHQEGGRALLALIGIRTKPCGGDGISLGKHGEARTLIQAGEGKPIAREIKDDRVNLLPTVEPWRWPIAECSQAELTGGRDGAGVPTGLITDAGRYGKAQRLGAAEWGWIVIQAHQKKVVVVEPLEGSHGLWARIRLCGWQGEQRHGAEGIRGTDGSVCPIHPLGEGVARGNVAHRQCECLGRVAVAGTAAAAAQINLNLSRDGVEAEIAIGAKFRLLCHLSHIPTEVEGSQSAGQRCGLIGGVVLCAEATGWQLAANGTEQLETAFKAAAEHFRA